MRFGRLSILFALLVATWSLAGARVNQATTPPKLRLQRGTFDLQRAPSTTTVRDPLLTAVSDLSIVQFSGPIRPEQRASLEATGVTILEYLPDYAYLVRGDDQQRNAIKTIDGLYGTAPFVVADKIAKGLTATNTPLLISVLPWPNGEAELAESLRDAGIDLSQPVDSATILHVASLDAVRWVDVVRQPKLQNGNARQIMRVNGSAVARTLYGNGQVVAVTDTGLDTGNIATIHPDFANRIAATFVLSTGQNWDDNHGHGTHVAGSVGASGVRSGANPATHAYTGTFAGVAPEASLVIQAFEADASGNVSGLGTDLYPIMEQVYNAGARIHSNSWADYTGPITDTEAQFGGYPYWSQRVDQFIWEHPDATILFAAGNTGKDGTPSTSIFPICENGNGVVDQDSLMTPATAKNVITVGSSESTNPAGAEGTPWMFMGQQCWFVTEPISSDTISDHQDGMAAFSARGPTDDGRIKPDIVSPGTNVISTRSYGSGASTLFGAHETNADYVYSGGTSMAAPLVAGMTALIREWMGREGMPNPSAAAVKAVLLNTSGTMGIGQYGGGATQELPGTFPNVINGWGRADLNWLNTPAPYGLWVDDHTAGLATGNVVNYTHSATQQLTVLTTTQPLRVMLAWSDPPASLSAQTQLVNNLDLVVTAPNGQQFYGNGVNADTLNNVEGVVISTPMLGTYQVRVVATNVPVGSQPYALTVAGPIDPDGLPGSPPVITPTPTPTATPTLTPQPPTLTPTLTPEPPTLTPQPPTLTPTLTPEPPTLTPQPPTLTPTLTPEPPTLTPQPPTLTPTLTPTTPRYYFWFPHILKSTDI